LEASLINRIIFLFFCFLLLFNVNAFAESVELTVSDNIKVNLNNKELAKPILVNEKAYVSLESFFQESGFEMIDWTPKDKTVRIGHIGNPTLGLSVMMDVNLVNVLYFPYDTSKVDDKEKNNNYLSKFKGEDDGSRIYMVEIEEVPILFHDAPYIPLRSFCEMLGGEIKWDNIQRTASVSLNRDKIADFWKSTFDQGKDDITQLTN
jgi:hypothetical protein